MGDLNPDTAGDEQLPANYSGLAKRLDQLEALIGTAADDEADNTVLGLLNTINSNTAP